MRFLMQIFQGEALEAWSRLSEEEQQGIAADYAALNEIPGVTSLLLKNKLSANIAPVPGSAKTLNVYVPGTRLTFTLAAAAFPVLMNPVPLSRYRLNAPSPPKVFQDCPPEFPDALASVRMTPVRVVALAAVGIRAIPRAHARTPIIRVFRIKRIPP